MFRDLEELLNSLPPVIEKNEELYELDIRPINGHWLISYWCTDEPDLEELHSESNQSLYTCADQMYIWAQKEGFLDHPFEE